jgi:hypothetical protein
LFFFFRFGFKFLIFIFKDDFTLELIDLLLSGGQVAFLGVVNEGRKVRRGRHTWSVRLSG